MFRNIAEVLTMIFIFIFVYSVFILACLITVQFTNGSLEMFIESPVAFIFYTFIIGVVGYGIYYILFILNRIKNGKTE